MSRKGGQIIFGASVVDDLSHGPVVKIYVRVHTYTVADAGVRAIRSIRSRFAARVHARWKLLERDTALRIDRSRMT